MRASSNTRSPILRALERLPRKKSRGRSNAGGDKGSFFAEGRLSSEALSVTVRGAGPLERPVRSEAARALHARATPARYGRRESTLLDTRVRDTGEIGTDALTVAWEDGVLPSLMGEVAHALKLHRLEARLHNLLVYGPGQFFKPHQDTEKQPGMVATLVLVWPCAHIGGELRVLHGDRQACFASQHLETDAIRWFAFYADCRHEVLPVTEGWRIVLTFDLVVPVGLRVPQLPVPPPLLEALRTHFFPTDGSSTRPWVYLLDHEYTQHGLRWGLLKGEDRPRVSTLRAAAESLGLIAHLALAEIHQQWTASPDYPDYRKRSRLSGNPQPDELIDESIALDYWVGGDDRPLRRDALHVRSSDVDSFTDTGASFLVDEEYEGYMGNYGETLAYWYRRAALVIQTPLAAEASRFVTEFDAALADALLLARAGRSVELAQRLQAAAQQLRARCQERGRALLRPYAELAVALPDAVHARALCEGFAWTSLKPSDAAALAELVRCWGPTWVKDLLAAWAQSSSRWDGYASYPQTEREAPLWPRPLPTFVRACVRARLQGEVIDAMLEQCLSALIDHDATLARQAPAARHATLHRRLKASCELVLALCLDPTRAAGRLDALLRRMRVCIRCAVCGRCYRFCRRAPMRQQRRKRWALPSSMTCSRRSPNLNPRPTTTACTTSNGRVVARIACPSSRGRHRPAHGR